LGQDSDPAAWQRPTGANIKGKPKKERTKQTNKKKKGVKTWQEILVLRALGPAAKDCLALW